MGGDALTDRLHHLEVDAEQVVAAHPGLARHAGGDDADVGPGDVGIVVGALQRRVEFLDRPRLRDVERLALRRAFGDVEEDDVAEFLDRGEMGEGAADLPRADEGNLGSGHVGSPGPGEWDVSSGALGNRLEAVAQACCGAA